MKKIVFALCISIVVISCSEKIEKDPIETLLTVPVGTKKLYTNFDMKDVNAGQLCPRFVANIEIDSSLADTIIDQNVKIAFLEMYYKFKYAKAYAIRAFNGDSHWAFLNAYMAPNGEWATCCDSVYTIDQFKISIYSQKH